MIALDSIEHALTIFLRGFRSKGDNRVRSEII